MYKIGFYGGSFDPVHLGHIRCIIQAINKCEKLFIVLSYSKQRDFVPYQIRFRVLKQIAKDFDNVEVIAIEDYSKDKNLYNWQDGAQQIKELIKDEINVVFAGSDYKNKKIFEKLYPNAKIEYINRTGIKAVQISSTEIRKNPLKYFEFLPNEMKPYYVKKVLIVGTESCGKSTLIKALANYYNTIFLEEVGRDVCEQAGGVENMIESDFFEIMFKHKSKEYQLEKLANKVLFIDTDSLITAYFGKIITCDNEQRIFNLAKQIYEISKYDVIFYLEPDVIWVQDGTRINIEGNARKKNNEILKTEFYDIMKAKYYSISGNYDERFKTCLKILDKILF